MTDHVTTHQAAEDARNEDILIYLNGQLLPKERALVSVYDSGFMLGDGVWEGLRLYNGTWAFMDEHLNRLFEAAKAVDIDIGMDRNVVERALRVHLELASFSHRRAFSPCGQGQGQCIYMGTHRSDCIKSSLVVIISVTCTHLLVESIDEYIRERTSGRSQDLACGRSH